MMAGAALCLALTPAPASADFGNIRRVFTGTAYTLDQGEFAVGIIGPMQYGVTDSVTLSLHPILELLLTPNLAVKWKLADGSVAVSLNLGYIETFLDPARENFPGTISFYPLVTIPFSSRVALSLEAGYLLDVSPLAHGLLFGGSISGLVTTADLLTLSVQEEYYRDDRGFGRPTVLLAYAHAFYQMRITVGIAFGHFPIQVGASEADIQDWPLYPVIDLWWQL